MPSNLGDRPLPQNLDAERSVLGAIVVNPEAIKIVSDKLATKDFFLGQHRVIYKHMLALRDAEQPIDSLTLVDRLTAAGDMEAAGGVGYVSSIGDGVPRLLNVGHHAAIVKQKAQLRDLIHFADKIGGTALEGVTPFDDLREQLEEYGRHAANGSSRARLLPAAFPEFSTMNFRPVSWVIEPVLPVQGMGMIYSRRGTGKTFVALEIAYCVAMGERCFCWDIPAPRRVLYVDGEMPANRMQERFLRIVRGHGMRAPSGDQLRIINPDLQDKVFPNVSTSEGQRMIEDHLRGDEFVVLDNLSALSGGERENEAEGWASIQGWLLRLRRHGISTLFLHHSGKSGDQRGYSGREDLLDVSINLRHPSDYNPADGLRAQIHFEKIRNTGQHDAIYPFELTMEIVGESISWFTKPLRDVIEQTAAKMFETGMNVREVAEDLHISRFQAYRLKRKMPVKSA